MRLCHASGRAVSLLDFFSVGRTGSRRVSGHCVSQRDYLSSGLHRLYCAYAVHLDAPSRRSTSRRSVAPALTVRPVTASHGITTSRLDCTSSTTPMPCIRAHRLDARQPVALALAVCPVIPLCVVTTRLAAATDILHLLPCDRVPWHVVRLVAWLITPLVVDYFAYATRQSASARRVTCHATRRQLLRLRLAVGCLGTSRGSSRGSSRRSSSTTSPTLRIRVTQHVAQLVTRLLVVYFDYTARSGASARRAARHAARRAARRRLLRLRCTSGCLGTLRGSSRGSSSTTSTMPRAREPQHVARLVTWLVVNYFDYNARSGVSAIHAARHAAHRRLLRLYHAFGCLGTWRSSSSTTSPTPRIRLLRHVTRLVAWLIVDNIAYATHPGVSARHAAPHRLPSPTLRVRVPRHVA
jgi:hypothetical protein